MQAVDLFLPYTCPLTSSDLGLSLTHTEKKRTQLHSLTFQYAALLSTWLLERPSGLEIIDPGLGLPLV